jgi:hypothetical protein
LTTASSQFSTIQFKSLSIPSTLLASKGSPRRAAEPGGQRYAVCCVTADAAMKRRRGKRNAVYPSYCPRSRVVARNCGHLHGRCVHSRASRHRCGALPHRHHERPSTRLVDRAIRHGSLGNHRRTRCFSDSRPAVRVRNIEIRPISDDAVSRACSLRIAASGATRRRCSRAGGVMAGLGATIRTCGSFSRSAFFVALHCALDMRGQCRDIRASNQFPEFGGIGRFM